ncbi:MAG: hypothetical protein ACLP5V_02705 [Candidatus Bathyarchaeia archaeon]
MMLISSSRNRKLIFGFMFGMIGVRLLMFALATVGVITWAPPIGASILSWIVPVGMPLAMISFMLLYGRKRMMSPQMKRGQDDAPLLDILQRRLALGQITKKQYEGMKMILLDGKGSSQSPASGI